MNGPAGVGHQRRQIPHDAGISEIGESAALPCDHGSSQVVVERQSAGELGGVFQILRGELHAGPAERLRHRGGGIGQHWHVGRHRLQKGRAEAFVLAERDVHGGVLVVDGELFVGDRAGEDEAIVQQPVLGHQPADHRIILRHRVMTADEDESVERVNIAFVVFGQADMVLDLLVGRDPPDEEKVDEFIVQQLLERRTRMVPGDPRRVDGQGNHPGRREPHGFELPPIVVGDARAPDRPARRAWPARGERAKRAERAPGSYGAKNAAGVTLWYWSTRPPRSEAKASVICDGNAKWNIVTSPRRAPGSSKGSHVAFQIIVDRERVELRGVAERAEHVSHSPCAVADRVAAMRRRHPLIDEHLLLRGPSPGRRASACSARASSPSSRRSRAGCTGVTLARSPRVRWPARSERRSSPVNGRCLQERAGPCRAMGDKAAVPRALRRRRIAPRSRRRRWPCPVAAR